MAGWVAPMSEACQYLHDSLSHLPRLGREDLAKVPANGVYVLFEKGEEAHGGDRIVRIGTHRGQNNLAPRIREHLYTQNKDRSIFRKHVGRCLLARAQDPLLEHWEIDLTTTTARETNAHKIDMAKLKEVENEVTRYMTGNFSFAVLSFGEQADRLRVEERLLSTIFCCKDCGPSETWLGKLHPKSAVIRSSGLWNVQGLKGPVLDPGEARRMVDAGQSG